MLKYDDSGFFRESYEGNNLSLIRKLLKMFLNMCPGRDQSNVTQLFFLRFISPIPLALCNALS